MISSLLLSKPTLQANQLGSLSRKSILVYLNTWVFSKCSLWFPTTLMSYLPPSCGCGGTRARSQSRYPQRALWALMTVPRSGTAHITHFLFGCLFNHPLGPFGYRDTNEKEMLNGNACIRLHSFQGLLRKW